MIFLACILNKYASSFTTGSQLNQPVVGLVDCLPVLPWVQRDVLREVFR